MKVSLSNTIYTLFVIFILFIVLTCKINAQEFDSGNGSKKSPWLIANAEQLCNVRNYAGEAGKDKYFRLKYDIDLSSYASGQGWISIGSVNNKFEGYFDGNHKTISNLTITLLERPMPHEFTSLFGYISANAIVENVKVKNVNISGIGSISGLVGNNSGGIIRNCSVEGGVISGKENYIAGLTCINVGSIINCHTNCSVKSSVHSHYTYVGGLVGAHRRGTIIDCYAGGLVDAAGYERVGGLVGECIDNASCINSYATNTVYGGSRVGGLVGSLSGVINNCYATGNVFGQINCIGGLIGFSYGATVTQCYASGNVTCQYSTAGGFVGRNEGTITDSYATGDINGSGSTYELGGFAGSNLFGKIINCYTTGKVTQKQINGFGAFSGSGKNGIHISCFFDINKTAQSYGIGDDPENEQISGKTTLEMQQTATFPGWDFGNIWQLCDHFYPQLVSIPTNDCVSSIKK